MTLYQIKNLSFSYFFGNQKSINPIISQQVLSDLSCTIYQGELTCIAGPSGSGKSTLLNILGFIEKIQVGSVFYGERNIKELDERNLDRIRMFEVGFVFQDFQLFDVLNVGENVEYFLTRQGHPSGVRRKKVEASLDAVGLGDYRKRMPRELSGGQKQRVAIARALAKEPKVIIADEPTANLDSQNALSVLRLFKELTLKYGQTTIMASHDPLAMAEASRLIELKDGRIRHDESRGRVADAG